MWLSYERGVETAEKQIEDIIFRGSGSKHWWMLPHIMLRG
jgi:hypothetical protein